MYYAACHYYRPIVTMDLSSIQKDSALIGCIVKLSEKTEGMLEEGRKHGGLRGATEKKENVLGK